MKTRIADSLAFPQRVLCTFAAALLALPPGALHALPSGVEVVHGDLTLGNGPGSLDIHQLTPEAIANWNAFSIGEDEWVNIRQLDTQSILLNRVTGADPSQLMGRLTANGRVFLINPNGIVVGQNASINTAEFLASALDITDADFLDGGEMHFSGESTESVVNLGTITAANGDVILIAHRVANEGAIEAADGVVALGAGNDVLLTPENDQRLLIRTELAAEAGTGTGVENSGIIEAAQAELKAAGGNLYELAVNQTGIVRATGVTHRNGRVLLTAEDGVVTHSGEISARDADGSGGEVLLGGDYRGENATIPNAVRTFVGDRATIDVNASAPDGDGGRAIVWADGRTDFFGSIMGRAGEEGGDGGFAEVSGKQYLNYRGFADLRAPQGRTGQLLLDPEALTVQADGTDLDLDIDPGDPTIYEPSAPEGSILLVSTLEAQLSASDVVLDTSGAGSIRVEDSVTWASGNALIFNSNDDISINADLDGGTGSITFALGFLLDDFGPPDEGSPASTAILSVAADASVKANSVTIKHNEDAFYQNTNQFAGPIGGIDFAGVLETDLLDIQYRGIAGTVSIDNPSNRIGTLRGPSTDGTITGDFSIVDGEGGLTVEGRFVGDEEADISIVTSGDLTLAEGTLIRTMGFEHEFHSYGSDIHLAAQGGAFINQAGNGAVDAQAIGRFLIYSDSPENLVADGLAGAPVYDKTFADNAPGTITQAGDRFLYSLAPVLTLTADDKSRTEDDPNPTLSFSVSGLVGTDTAVDAFSGEPELSTTAVADSVQGDYPIAIAQGSVLLSDYDYGLNLVGGFLTINPGALRDLIIRANDVLRYFGDPNPEFTASFDGFRTGDDADVVEGLEFSTTANPESPVNNYTITPFGATAEGYAINFQDGTLTIQPRPLTIGVDDIDKVYGDALTGLTATFDNLAGFDTPAVLGSIEFATGASPQFAGVGDYVITPSGAQNTNYAISYTTGTAFVIPRPATITADDQTREYGLANPAFTVSRSGFLSNDFINASGSLVFDTASENDDVGSYAIVPSGFSDTNYDVTYSEGTLEITPALLSLTADSFSREYGLANPTFSYQVNGSPRLGQSLESIVENIELTTTATRASSVGDYPIVPDADLINSNYEVSFNDGQLTITPAPLQVAPALSSRLYGDPDPDFTLTASGLRNEDTVGVVTGAVFQNNTPPFVGVGSYPIQLLNAQALNYDITLGNGTMNVLPRPLTITADSFTREYGEANPMFTAQFDGLASFDDSSVIPGLSLSTPATANSNVLENGYGINVSSGTNANYEISYVPGTLTIAPAPLLVEVDNVSREYGEANPGFSGTIATGFKLGQTIDDLLLDLTTDATVTANVGNHAIEASSFNVNYALHASGGMLSITPAPLTVSVETFQRMYGEENPATYAFNLGGLKFEADREGLIEVINPTVFNTDVGAYAFDARTLNGNYRIAAVDGDIFIAPRRVNLDFSNASRRYGDDPLSTGQFLDFIDLSDAIVAGDVPGDVFSISSTARNVSDVGTYPIDVGVLDSNYMLSSVSGELSVTPRPLAVLLEPFERAYGDANPGTYDHLQLEGVPNGLLPFDPLNTVLSISAPSIEADVGTYDLSAELISDNYSLETFEGRMTIAPRQITLRPPESFHRYYGNPNPSVEFEVLSPDVPGMGLTSFHTVDDVATVTLPEIDAPANRYGMRFATNPNYHVDFAAADSIVSVDPRPISVALPGVTRLYGSANPPAEVQIVGGEGLAAWHTIDLLFGPVELPPVTAGVGQYTVTETRHNPNYAITVASGSEVLTIVPRRLELAIPTLVRLYGDPNPEMSIDIVGGDGLSEYETLDDIIVLNPPPIDIPAGALHHIIIPQGNDNYDFEIVSGYDSAVIEPRVITVEVGHGVKSYGDPAAEFSGTIGGDGLASFETLEDALNLDTYPTIHRYSLPGHYLISGTLADSRNYVVESFEPGVLTILPRPLRIIVHDAEAVLARGSDLFGDHDFSDLYGATFEGFVGDDTQFSEFPFLDFAVIDENTPAPVFQEPSIDLIKVPTVEELSDYLFPGNPFALRPWGENLQQLDSSLFRPMLITGETIAEAVPEVSSTPAPVSSGTWPGSEIVTAERIITLSGGYRRSSRYIVTGVDNGLLSLRTRTQQEEIRHEMNRMGYGSEHTIEISNAGPLSLVGFFERNPDFTYEFITAYFDRIFAEIDTLDPGQIELYAAITGRSGGGYDALSPYRIKQFIARAQADPELMTVLAEPLVEYATALQEKPSSQWTPMERQFTGVIAAEFQKKRDAQAALLRTRLEQYHRDETTATSYYALQGDLEVLEQRAANAARGFLDFETRITREERDILALIEAAAADTDGTSAIAYIEEWIEIRKDHEPKAFIDTQMEGFRSELQAVANTRAELLARLESGSTGPEREVGMMMLFQNRPPYSQILKEVQNDALVAKLANYDIEGSIAEGIGSGTAGAAAGAATFSAPKAVVHAILPHFKNAANFSGRFAGPAGIVFTAVITATIATVDAIQHEEQTEIFRSLVEDEGRPVSYHALDFSPAPDVTAADYDPKPGDMKAIIEKTLMAEVLGEFLMSM